MDGVYLLYLLLRDEVLVEVLALPHVNLVALNNLVPNLKLLLQI